MQEKTEQGVDWICIKKSHLFPVRNKADEQRKDVTCGKATAGKWITTYFFSTICLSDRNLSKYQ